MSNQPKPYLSGVGCRACGATAAPPMLYYSWPHISKPIEPVYWVTDPSDGEEPEMEDLIFEIIEGFVEEKWWSSKRDTSYPPDQVKYKSQWYDVCGFREHEMFPIVVFGVNNAEELLEKFSSEPPEICGNCFRHFVTRSVGVHLPVEQGFNFWLMKCLVSLCMKVKRGVVLPFRCQAIFPKTGYQCDEHAMTYVLGYAVCIAHKFKATAFVDSNDQSRSYAKVS